MMVATLDTWSIRLKPHEQVDLETTTQRPSSTTKPDGAGGNKSIQKQEDVWHVRYFLKKENKVNPSFLWPG